MPAEAAHELSQAHAHDPQHAGADAGRRRGLAKGLSALLGDLESELSGERGPDGNGNGGAGAGLRTLPVDMIAPSPLQPRRHFDAAELDELAASIAAQGILQPLLVRPDPRQAGRFEIVAGERRWRAAQQARLHEVPVLVRELADADVLCLALVENLQRADLSPLEEAQGYQRLQEEFGQTQDDVARVVGRSRSHVTNTLRLLTLPESVKAAVAKGTLSAGHARALLGAADPAACAAEVLKRGLNVRQTERLAKRRAGMTRGRPHDPNADALAHDLGLLLGLSVSILHGGRGGTLAIRYKTLAELDEVVKRLRSGGGPRVVGL